MSLPEILVPAGAPGFRAQGQAIALQPVYADLPLRTGHGRKRRVQTSAPRKQKVSWRLNRTQMLAVDDWFENVLLAGKRRFSAEVFAQGPGSLWWAAEWVAPYNADPQSGGFWIVTGELLLTGDGSVDAPANTTAAVEFVVALTVNVSIPGGGYGAVEFAAALRGVALGAVEFTAALHNVAPGYYGREDAGYIQREDGTPLQRE